MERLKIEEYKEKYLGKKFNHLLITDIFKVPKYGWEYTYCHCKCDCGNETDTVLTNVINGKTKSCGCIKKQNKTRILNSEIVEVMPTNSNSIDNTFFVDQCTWNLFKFFPWYIDNTGYMATDIAQTYVRYHHLLLATPPNYVIDHINRNKRVNIYSNLRVVTQALNILNRGASKNSKSGYQGIVKTGDSTWQVQMRIPGSNGQRRNKIVHSLQEAISLREMWANEIFAAQTFDAPRLILPNGQINLYFRFDWFHPRYIKVWKELGIVVYFVR